jgi:hypothetical protein
MIAEPFIELCPVEDNTSIHAVIVLNSVPFFGKRLA